MTEKLKNPFKINELVTAVNSLVDEKQDLISDLSTIRSGAALGATALQSITSSNVITALGYTPYDSSNPNAYQTSTQVTNSISNAITNKQDTLVSGTNIKTINNESILGSGNITISGGGSDVEEYSIAEIEALWNGENE